MIPHEKENDFLHDVLPPFIVVTIIGIILGLGIYFYVTSANDKTRSEVKETELSPPTQLHVETDVAMMITELPDGDFKLETVEQFKEFQRGRAVDRTYLLKLAKVIGLEVDEEISTQHLIDLLANAYYEEFYK